MGNIKNRSVVIIYGVFQYFLWIHVQMVCRFVQNKEIRLWKHYFCQRYSSLFTARKSTYCLKYIVFRKYKGSQYVAYFAVCHIRIGVMYFVEYGVFIIKFMVFLVIVSGVNVNAKNNFAEIGFKLIEYYFKKRTFSYTVRPDNGNFFSSFDFKGYVGKQLIVSETHR